MDPSERETYQAAIHGDREAFEMIIRAYSRTLFAIAYGILQNREEAEDVVQDSLVKAWKTRWRVRDPEKFPAWLDTIARHRAHDIFRKRRNVSLSEQIAEPIEQEPNDTTALDQQLHSALAALPELHRTALTLRYFEEMIIAPSKIRWVSRMARFAEFLGVLSRPCANSFARLSLQWTRRMATIHDELDSWLTADLHGELSDSERSALHAHLVECAVCRRTHQETKTMNKILEETLADENADPAFEERMLAGFRNRIPQTTGVAKLFANLIRLRAAQIAAVAAVLLGLV